MAPNKKKKKPASNPSRGFATISTASKPKVEDIEAHAPGAEPNTAIVGGEIVASNEENKSILRTNEPEKALGDLTPEELEKQLEETELQDLVEQFGEKSKKDASRQVVRLQTERRLSRSQADTLNTRQWLPQDIMLLIFACLDAESTEDWTSGEKLPTNISEDDLLIKTWTVTRILPQLGVSADNTRLAIRNLLNNRNVLSSQMTSGGKDSIWGLDESLDWLAWRIQSDEIPHYDADIRKPVTVHSQPETIAYTVDTAVSTPSDSRPASPISQPPMDSQSTTSDPNATSQITDSGSDSDSALEPDQMVSRYLALKSRLHQTRPELVDSFDQRAKKAKAGARKGKMPANQSADPRTSRLLAKIAKIESDVLFDHDEASRKWSESRIQLMQEAAERKRFNVANENKVNRSRPPEDENDNKSEDQDEDGAGMLGELFTNLPVMTTDITTGISGIDVPSEGGVVVHVRDFGRWSGLSPRRIFEEACRSRLGVSSLGIQRLICLVSRDPSSTISYRVESQTSLSKRHSLEIRWSRNQDSVPGLPISAVFFEGNSRFVYLKMNSISCPDTNQSEAYISTVALFTIFASSLKEDKVHLRLPPAWRDLWTELADAKRERDHANDREILRELQGLIAEHTTPTDDASGGMGTASARIFTADALPIEAGTKVPPSAVASENIKAIWVSKASSLSYQNMLTSRSKLPIWNFKTELLDAIEDNQVIIVCGETGCGKSTQVPVYILEYELSHGRPCKVYCTEPRRISAISLARRVSEELGERKGDVGTSRSLVGYAIRLESQVTPQTRLVYATTGIVMRMLERSDDLEEITHLVLDEVHERSIDSDFLLIILRKLLLRRPSLKAILMSATVDAQRFSRYLDQAPIMTVPGRTFPVETKYLEDAVEATKYEVEAVVNGGRSAGDQDEDDDPARDPASKSPSAASLQGYSVKTRNTLAKLDEYQINYDLIVRLLETIANANAYALYSKAILVFLPGIAEIRRLHDMLLGHRTFTHDWYIHSLHSTIATEEQERAFSIPPQGIRKIVLATNIAETGITIPDVTCVIDTGKHKEMRFDERRQLSRLIESFISRANAKQRRGRAGRVQKGLCFHLFTKNRHDNLMAEEQTPEMLRLSLQDLVLRVKICKLGGVEQTLSEALDPPSSRNVRRAVDALVDVKALTATEELTPLGRQLARLPLDVFLGKLILLGRIFGCLDAMLTIAGILSSKAPFTAPIGARSQADLARIAFKKGDSDLLTVYNAYCAWRRICSSSAMSEQQFCRKNFLSQQTLSNIEDLKGQLITSMADARFVTLDDSERASLNRVRFYSRKRLFVEVPARYNANNGNDLILDSVIAWSFYPKLLRRDGKGWRNIANNQSVSLHPTSVNKGVEHPPVWLSFYHIMQSSNRFYNAHETSTVEDFAVALLCGEADFKMYSGVIVIDGYRTRFSVNDWKTMLAIKTLRTQLRQIMAQSFRNPSRAITSQQQAWFDIWQKIFSPKVKEQK